MKEPTTLIEAIKYFSVVIEKNPSYARSHFYRGMAYLEAGDGAKAIKDIEMAQTIQKDDLYEQVLGEIRGQVGRESIFATFVICFQSGNPPQSRPFGYVWEIQHPVR